MRPQRAANAGQREPEPCRPEGASCHRGGARLSLGLGESSNSGQVSRPHHPDTQHTALACPRRQKPVSVVLAQENGQSGGFKVPRNRRRAFAGNTDPVQGSLVAQMTEVDNAALALGSRQASRSTPRSRCIYPLVSRCMKGTVRKRKSSAFEWEAQTVPVPLWQAPFCHQVAPEARRFRPAAGLGDLVPSAPCTSNLGRGKSTLHAPFALSLGNVKAFEMRLGSKSPSGEKIK